MPIVKIAGAARRTLCQIALACWIAASAGCLAKVHWRQPADHLPLRVATAIGGRNLLRAQVAYAAAQKFEKECSDECVDLYFQAAALTHQACIGCDADCPESQIHRSALTRLIITGEQFGRLDPRSGLSIIAHGERQCIPIAHHGFVWEAEEFDHLEPVGDYSTHVFRDAHRQCGCGVPLIVSSSCQHPRPLLGDRRVFAATAVLQAASAPCDSSELGGEGQGSSGWALELYDPLRIDTIAVDGQNVPLAKDISAPIAYRLRGQRRTLRDNFIGYQPSGVESRLYALEPHQPGKIPVVLVYGLLGEPSSWAEVINELQATRGFVNHFQIWLFEYPTGQSFLLSAASMREQLATAQQVLDPQCTDAALAQTVLVGHSMGGLVSKLQVTSSGDQLWRSIANRPIEQTVMQPEMRRRLTDAFFFEPSPLVSRVVFIGTPHQGSAEARRLVGRVASLLVVEPPETREAHRRLIESNPGVFSPEFTRRMPTSIDLLDPDSPLLQALYALPIEESVRSHSIIGDSCWTIGYGPSDGVVPVSSARYPGAQSERYIATTHAKLHRDVESIAELQRILKEHLHQAMR